MCLECVIKQEWGKIRMKVVGEEAKERAGAG